MHVAEGNEASKTKSQRLTGSNEHVFVRGLLVHNSVQSPLNLD